MSYEILRWVIPGVFFLYSFNAGLRLLLSIIFTNKAKVILNAELKKLDDSRFETINRVNKLWDLGHKDAASPEAKEAIWDLSVLAENGANDRYARYAYEATERIRKEIEWRVKTWPF